jgi:hypothetical protein
MSSWRDKKGRRIYEKFTITFYNILKNKNDINQKVWKHLIRMLHNLDWRCGSVVEHFPCASPGFDFECHTKKWFIIGRKSHQVTTFFPKHVLFHGFIFINNGIT